MQTSARKLVKVDESKDELVTECLCRWWYALPDWPPPMDWAAELEKQDLRQVAIEKWEDEADVVDGKSKVYAIGHYPGLFRDHTGQIRDLRPQDSCPSRNNFR